MKIINKIIITFIIASLSAPIPLQSIERPIILRDLLAPESIAADRHRLYISQREEVLVYSLEDHTLIRRFGRAGEGPKEFKLMEDKPLLLYVEGPDIVVNSWNKVSFFTKPGTFKTELRFREPLSTNYLPLAGCFVAMSIRAKNNARQRVISLYDQSLKKQKELFLRTQPQQKNSKIKILQKSFQYTVHAGSLIIAPDNTFTIYIFDPDGAPRQKISLPNHPRRPFTPGDKQHYINLIKRNAANNNLYKIMKDRLQFPTQYPALQTIHAADNTIYAITWNKTNQSTQTLRFTLSGKQLPQPPLKLHYQDPFTPAPHTIANHTLYQLTETPDTAWQLRITDLK